MTDFFNARIVIDDDEKFASPEQLAMNGLHRATGLSDRILATVTNYLVTEASKENENVVQLIRFIQMDDLDYFPSFQDRWDELSLPDKCNILARGLFDDFRTINSKTGKFNDTYLIVGDTRADVFIVKAHQPYNKVVYEYRSGNVVFYSADAPQGIVHEDPTAELIQNFLTEN